MDKIWPVSHSEFYNNHLQSIMMCLLRLPTPIFESNVQFVGCCVTCGWGLVNLLDFNGFLFVGGLILLGFSLKRFEGFLSNFGKMLGIVLGLSRFFVLIDISRNLVVTIF